MGWLIGARGGSCDLKLPLSLLSPGELASTYDTQQMPRCGIRGIDKTDSHTVIDAKIGRAHV